MSEMKQDKVITRPLENWNLSWFLKLQVDKNKPKSIWYNKNQFHNFKKSFFTMPTYKSNLK